MAAKMLQNPAPALLFLLFSCLSAFCSAQTCKSYTLMSNNLYTSCNDLPYLNSYIFWTYDSVTGNFQMAFRQTGVTTSNWVSWAINPSSQGMVGAQALVAFQQSGGNWKAYPAPITSYSTTLSEGTLSYTVSNLTATYTNGEIVIFAVWDLPPNSTAINQVWQQGPLSGGTPAPHSLATANTQSMGSLNLVSGQGSSGGLTSAQKKRNTHGILNAVSWGIMMPVGVMIARYVRMFEAADPAWFYLHMTCQTSAYIIGVAGWATGLKLGSESPAVEYSTHRNIGIALFVLATLQVFALLLRPKKDHKYRFYWNIYHHNIGYAVITLGIINIFKGLDILKPKPKYKNAYIGVIASLAIIAALMETFKWSMFFKRKREERKLGVNGAMGGNGFGGRA